MYIYKRHEDTQLSIYIYIYIYICIYIYIYIYIFRKKLHTTSSNDGMEKKVYSILFPTFERFSILGSLMVKQTMSWINSSFIYSLCFRNYFSLS